MDPYVEVLVCPNEFQYGRMYQLVLDKSKAHKPEPGRGERMQKYIKTRCKEEIIVEAIQILLPYRNRRKDWHNLLENSPPNGDFYFGRCVQFLLDSNHKRKYEGLIVSRIATVKKAHDEKQRQLTPGIGSVEFDVSNQCDTEECTWTYGEKRCDCGNMKFDLYIEPVTSLDTTELTMYPEPD